MAKVDVSVSVEKSPYDVMAKLADLVKAVKLAGGFQASAIPAEVGALVADLPALVADCGQIPADLAEDKVAFVKGGVLGAELVVEALLAK